MKSLSRLIKHNRLILGDQAYQLAPQIFIPPERAEDTDEVDEAEEHELTLEELQEQAKVEIAIRTEEAEEEIRQRLAEAERDREAIIGDAYEQAKIITETAKKEGYEAGNQAGFEEGRAIAETLIQEALAIKAQAQERKENIVLEIEKEVVHLIVDTTERILNKHVQEDYDLILGIVQLAMAKLTYTESLSLRVANEDFDLALSMKDHILALAENVDDIVIKADKSLRAGSCIVDATAGSIDSSVWTQFEQIKQAFEELLSSE